MTPAEWQAHAEAWERQQRLKRDVFDFHASRICAYIRNWSGRMSEKWVEDPRELMVHPPEAVEQSQAEADDPVKASLRLMAMWDFVAPHLE